MSFNVKKLYELLPSLYRIRDTELGIKMLSAAEKSEILDIAGNPDEKIQGPLKSLLSIIAEQIAVLEENLDQLYDDQFIETCAEWVVSYIGGLTGTRGLISIPGASFSQRGEVANTISYRRRKGTASVIEQLAHDVTGWNANTVEYFQLLATTQYMNHLRPENLSVASLKTGNYDGNDFYIQTENLSVASQKKWDLLEYANTPFDKMAHTADVRRIEKKRGKYNIQNIGVFLWRINSYSVTKSPAYKVDDRRYTFDALGKNTKLYNLPETEDEITHLADPVNVPMPISRRVLANYTDTYYGQDKKEDLTGLSGNTEEQKSILIYIDGKPVIPDLTISPDQKLTDLISICNLSDVLDVNNVLQGWAHLPQDKIAVDPVLGRIAFPDSMPPPQKVHVNFYYGFSDEMGGGEYDRANTFSDLPETKVIEVKSEQITIQDALDQLADTGGVVEIMDNEYYFETPFIKVAKGKTIELRAADKTRPVLVLEGEILIEAEENTTVILNGLLVSGGRIRLPLINSDGSINQLKLLRVVHCTLLPGSSPAILAIPGQPAMARIVVELPGAVIELEKTITGALKVFDDSKVYITNSIVDAQKESEVAYAGVSDGEPGGTLHIKNSTIIGKVYTRIMEMASNTIFMAGGIKSAAWPAPVRAQRLQQGCVRFSYIPPGSRLPRLYHCQPAAEAIAARVRPVFTSLTYGDPGYCQLGNQCAPEIKQGADDEAEMGVFHDLYQPQREANLRSRLDEYLRFGLEAGIFYAS